MPETPYYSESTALPQSSASDLEYWWMPSMVSLPGYRAFRVKVVNPDPRAFTFDLVEGPTQETGLVVDLVNTWHVWPGIPSTAVHAKPGQFGYLLLSDPYMKIRVTEPKLYADGSGKWPFGADSVLQVRADARNKVLSSASEFLSALAAFHESP